MSDCLVMCRPVYSLPLAGGMFEMSTPAYAHPSMTSVVWVDPNILLSLRPRYYNEEKLSAAPYEKGTAPGEPIAMPRAHIMDGQYSFPIIAVNTPGLLEYLADRGATRVPLAITAQDYEYIAPFARQTLEAEGPIDRVEDVCLYTHPCGKMPYGYTDFVPIEDLEAFIRSSVKVYKGFKSLLANDQDRAEYAALMTAESLLKPLHDEGVTGIHTYSPQNAIVIVKAMQESIETARAVKAMASVQTCRMDSFNAQSGFHPRVPATNIAPAYSQPQAPAPI